MRLEQLLHNLNLVMCISLRRLDSRLVGIYYKVLHSNEVVHMRGAYTRYARVGESDLVTLRMSHFHLMITFEITFSANIFAFRHLTGMGL